MITPYIPYPPYSGGQTRSYFLLKHLSKHCDITLFNFELPDQGREGVEHLKKLCKKVISIPRGKTWQPKKILTAGLTPYPFLVVNYLSSELKQQIKQELETNDYDLVHVECFYLMPNVPKTDIPVLLVDQTIEFAVYQHYVETLPIKYFFLKPLLWLDVLKIKYWEKRFWQKADKLIAVSEDDQELMERISKRQTEVVRNGVNENLIIDQKKYQPKQPTVFFGVANFNWMQNKEGARHLLKEVWPKIKKRVPKAKLVIAGRHSKEFVESTNLLPEDKTDIKVGPVDDPAQAYQQASVLVAPIKSGGGSRTKFFEAMACQLPIATTKQGMEGIEAVNNKHAVIAKDFDDLVDKTVALLNNPEQQKKIGKQGQQLVKDKYSWRQSAQELLKLYQKSANE
jgi:glycosyltransferase involved in cell wall biosynthesis